MKYYILVNGKKLRPTNGEPYKFNKYMSALKVVRMCYGEDRLNKTIKIVKE